jgi:hypothetical protein
MMAVIMFLRNVPLHWISYAMFPKGCHIAGFDSMGENECFKRDIQALWRWLDDDLRVH